MAFVATATFVGGGSALLGGALIGAGVGGLYSAITGDGDILNSMLTGGLIGGAGAFGLQSLGVGAAAPAVTAPAALASAPASTALVPTANAITATPALQATGLKAAATAAPGISAIPAASTFGSLAAPTVAAAPSLASLTTPVVTGSLLPAGYGAASTAAGASGAKMLGYGLAGTTALSLLGGRGGKGAQAPASATDPGMIRQYDYSSTPNEPTGTYPSPYATAEYNEAGNPILDTRERNYFNQNYAAMQPYSARTGTVNPNIPVTMAARGGLMFDDESGMDEARGLMQGNLQKGLFGMGYAEGGEVDLDQERNKLIMKNIKSASTKDLEKIMGAMNQQEFLMKNMPNYAEAMRPTISGMVEGAQYGDRMTKAYEDIAKKRAMEMGENFVPQENYARIQPTMVNPQSGMYGGIASIGRQVDPNTRVNAMANIQRTPYDRNAMESVRRLGVGVDRQLGRNTNLSAFYEQDPMGRDKMGGARLTQQFADGGLSSTGFLGYGQTEDKPVRRTNPVGEYLVNSIFNTPTTPSANVLGGVSSGTESSSSSSNPAESNPILRAMYEKQIENPDYQFTQPELVSGYQAYNPYAFSYNPSTRKYSAANPNEQQLSSFKQQMADYMAQDRARRQQEQAAAQGMQSYDGGAGGANGGLMPYNLGGYSDGGRLLRGPGDGVSDDIPAVIGNRQPARLADGEFVIPARIVSELGNGSTDAGAKRLYAMMDRIQAGRKKTIGKKNVAKDTKAKKHLLA